MELKHVEHIAHRSTPRRALAGLQLARQTRVGILMHNSQIYDDSPPASFSSLSLLGGGPCQLSQNKPVLHFAFIPSSFISGPSRSRREHSQAKLFRVRRIAFHSDSHCHSFGGFFCAHPHHKSTPPWLPEFPTASLVHATHTSPQVLGISGVSFVTHFTPFLSCDRPFHIKT